MKVEAICNVRHEGIRYDIGDIFEHENPKIAIQYGLVKLVENGKKGKGKGSSGLEVEVQGEAIAD